MKKTFFISLISLTVLLLHPHFSSSVLAKAISSSEETGFCCFKGSLKETSEKQCKQVKGDFYSAKQEDLASKECQSDETGYCCSNGNLFNADENECGRKKGTFYPEKKRSVAIKECAEQVEGYCCDDGKLSQITKGKCDSLRGKFFNLKQKQLASKTCSENSNGLCCDDGKLHSATQKQCTQKRGVFYKESDKKRAQKECSASQTGFCCTDGELLQLTSNDCSKRRGTFFPATQKSRAVKSCRDSQQGYCCSNGQIKKASKDICLKRKGYFSMSIKDAEKECQQAAGYCCDNGKIIPSEKETCDQNDGIFSIRKAELVSKCKPSARLSALSANGNTSLSNREAGIDLFVKSISLESKKGNKDPAPYTASVIVTNNGMEKAKASKLVLTLRPTGAGKKGTPLSHTISCPALKPGESRTLRWELPTKTSLPAGKYLVIARVDSSNSIKESNERNNLFRQQLSLSGNSLENSNIANREISSAPSLQRAGQVAQLNRQDINPRQLANENENNLIRVTVRGRLTSSDGTPLPNVSSLRIRVTQDREGMNYWNIPLNEQGSYAGAINMKADQPATLHPLLTSDQRALYMGVNHHTFTPTAENNRFTFDLTLTPAPDGAVTSHVKGVVQERGGDPAKIYEVLITKFSPSNPVSSKVSIHNGSFHAYLTDLPGTVYEVTPLPEEAGIYPPIAPQQVVVGDSLIGADFIVEPIEAASPVRTVVSGTVLDTNGNVTDYDRILVMHFEGSTPIGSYHPVNRFGEYDFEIIDEPGVRYTYVPKPTIRQDYQDLQPFEIISGAPDRRNSNFVVFPENSLDREFRTTVNGTIRGPEGVSLEGTRIRVSKHETPDADARVIHFIDVNNDNTFTYTINDVPGIRYRLEPVTANPALGRTYSDSFVTKARNSTERISFSLSGDTGHTDSTESCTIFGHVTVNDGAPSSAQLHINNNTTSQVVDIQSDGTYSAAFPIGQISEVFVRYRLPAGETRDSEKREYICRLDAPDISANFALTAETAQVKGRVLSNGHFDSRLTHITLQRHTEPRSTVTKSLVKGRYTFDVYPDVNYTLIPHVPEGYGPVDNISIKLAPDQEEQIVNFDVHFPEFSLGDLEILRYIESGDRSEIEVQIEANLTGGQPDRNYRKTVRLYSVDYSGIDLRSRCLFTSRGGNCTFRIPEGGFGFSNTSLNADIVGLEDQDGGSMVYPRPFQSLIDRPGDLEITEVILDRQNHEIQAKVDSIGPVGTQACRMGVKVNNSTPRYYPLPPLRYNSSHTVNIWEVDALTAGDVIDLQIDNQCEPLSGNNRKLITITQEMLNREEPTQRVRMQGSSSLEWSDLNPANWFD